MTVKNGHIGRVHSQAPGKRLRAVITQQARASQPNRGNLLPSYLMQMGRGYFMRFNTVPQAVRPHCQH